MEHWDSKSPEDYHNLVSNRDARICLNLAQLFHGPVELTYYRNKQARLFINEKGRITIEFYVQSKLEKANVVNFQLPFLHVHQIRMKAPDTGPRDFESNRHGINPPLACLEMEVDDFTIGKLWETFGDKKEFDAKFYRMSMRDLPYNSAVRSLLFFISPFSESDKSFIQFTFRDNTHQADFDELYNFFEKKIRSVAEYEKERKKLDIKSDYISFVDDAIWKKRLSDFGLVSYRNDLARNAPTICYIDKPPVTYVRMRQPGYGMDTGAVKVMKMADGSRLGVKQANEFDLQFEANQNLAPNGSSTNKYVTVGVNQQNPLLKAGGNERKVGKLVRTRHIETITCEDEELVSESSSQSQGGDSQQSNQQQQQQPALSLDAWGAMPLIVYPKNDRAPISLANSDMRVMAHDEMLNDTIIEFYLRFIQNELVPAERRPKICILSSFLYQRLTDKLTLGMCRRNGRAAANRFDVIRKGFQMVKTWTRKKNLFDMDYIVFPVNEEYLIVVVKPRLAVSEAPTEDPVVMRLPGSSRPNPDTYIVVLDSLPDPTDIKRNVCVDIVRDYLECEFLDKKPMEGILERTRLAAVHPLNTPVQKNFIDCGLYMLLFAELFLTKPPNHEVHIFQLFKSPLFEKFYFIKTSQSEINKLY
ncbi:hypothetical protein WR25_27147 [Diploscapter pachys]|uniref:Ubiquitin-like protease family profile domain-containing protein n=1 Tax=Diploscapter pachys TaxID=2018661 RepID=A0A2A2LW74_9BILA|nr:hypothetical protein WR25_27147 [Diploscapter pachys]